MGEAAFVFCQIKLEASVRFRLLIFQNVIAVNLICKQDGQFNMQARITYLHISDLNLPKNPICKVCYSISKSTSKLILKYQFYEYLIVDKGTGPVEAVKRNGILTDGVKRNLVLFWLMLIGIDILGMLLSEWD